MLLAVLGPSGAGKSTFVRQCVAQLGFRHVVAVTTRPPRAGERGGVDYHFVGRAEFEDRLLSGEFTVWDYIADHYYGQDLDRSGGPRRDVSVMSVRMAVDLRRCGARPVTVFLDAAATIKSGRVAERDWAQDEARRRADWDADQLRLRGLADHYEDAAADGTFPRSLEFIRRCVAGAPPRRSGSTVERMLT